MLFLQSQAPPGHARWQGFFHTQRSGKLSHNRGGISGILSVLMFLIILRLIATFSKSESNYLSCENKVRKREKQAEIRADLMSCLLSGSLLIANTTTMIKDVPHSRSSSPAEETRMCPLPRRLFRGGCFTTWLVVILYLGCNLERILEENKKSLERHPNMRVAEGEGLWTCIHMLWRWAVLS